MAGLEIVMGKQLMVYYHKRTKNRIGLYSRLSSFESVAYLSFFYAVIEPAFKHRKDFEINLGTKVDSH